jgi:hypothetical protein
MKGLINKLEVPQPITPQSTIGYFPSISILAIQPCKRRLTINTISLWVFPIDIVQEVLPLKLRVHRANNPVRAVYIKLKQR